MRERDREKDAPQLDAIYLRTFITHSHTLTQIIWQLSDWAIDWLPDRLTHLPPLGSNTLGQTDSAIIWGEINVQRVQWHRLMANFSQYIEFTLLDSPPHCCCQQQQRHVLCQGQGQGRSKGCLVRRGSVAKKAATQLRQMMRDAEMPH